MIGRLLAREWRAGVGGVWLPVAFLLLVAVCFPFAVGNDEALLRRAGGGVLWIAALLAALLPVGGLVAGDREDGTLDQLRLHGVSEEAVAGAKLAGHWLAWGPATLAAAALGALLMGLDAWTAGRLLLGLLLGTPGLAALAVTVAALTAGLPGGSALAPLLLLPLAVPVLVFGAGVANGESGSIPLLAAASLVLIAAAPFAAGASIRAGRG